MTSVLQFPVADPDAVDVVQPSSEPTTKLGRPSKKELERRKKPGVVGRPPGTAARVREFHARLLATKGDYIIETIMRKALDDTDKDQIAALKMCVDRLLPLSYFEKGTGGNKPMINIQIMTTNGQEDNTVTVQAEAEDIEYSEEPDE